MGILTAVFVASESEVVSTDFAPLFLGDLFSVLEAKGISEVSLEALSLVLADQDLAVLNEDVEALWYEGSGWDQYVGVKMDHSDEDDGPWIQRFPDRLEMGLSMLSASGAAEVGRKWAIALWAEQRRVEAQLDVRDGPLPKTGILDRVLHFIFTRHSQQVEPDEPREQDFVNGVTAYAERLRQLSRIARDEGKHLYLWTSL